MGRDPQGGRGGLGRGSRIPQLHLCLQSKTFAFVLDKDSSPGMANLDRYQLKFHQLSLLCCEKFSCQGASLPE